MNLVPLITASVAILGVLILGFAYFRASTSKVWQETAAGYKERADLLESQLHEAQAQILALQSEVAILKAKTDLTELTALIMRQHSELLHSLNKDPM